MMPNSKDPLRQIKTAIRNYKLQCIISLIIVGIFCLFKQATNYRIPQRQILVKALYTIPANNFFVKLDKWNSFYEAIGLEISDDGTLILELKKTCWTFCFGGNVYRFKVAPMLATQFDANGFELTVTDLYDSLQKQMQIMHVSPTQWSEVNNKAIKKVLFRKRKKKQHAFTKLSILGTGFQSTVYKVVDADGGVYALKVFSESVDCDRERKNLESIHRMCEPMNVPKVFSDNQLCKATNSMILQYIDGCKSIDELEESKLEWNKEEMKKSVAHMIRTFNAKGIDHDDIHAGNIVRDKDGKWWLIDFGRGKRKARIAKDDMTALKLV